MRFAWDPSREAEKKGDNLALHSNQARQRAAITLNAKQEGGKQQEREHHTGGHHRGGNRA